MRTETLLVLGLSVFAGCRQDMHDQPRYEPLEASDVFGDGRSSRPYVDGTVARGQARLDETFYTGRANGELVKDIPLGLDRDLLERGRERFGIYCTPCHGQLGDGNGMVVQRGLKRPTSFHDDRLREMPLGHFFDVITNGFGTMYDYSARVTPRDRWAIAAYVRALQLSQRARFAELPSEDQAKLQEAR